MSVLFDRFILYSFSQFVTCLESFHRGVICIVNSNHEVVLARADIHQLCDPRSAMKLLQALPLMTMAGMDHFGFRLEELAVMWGSPNAEPDQVRVVDRILHKIGYHRHLLVCF